MADAFEDVADILQTVSYECPSPTFWQEKLRAAATSFSAVCAKGDVSSCNRSFGISTDRPNPYVRRRIVATTLPKSTGSEGIPPTSMQLLPNDAERPLKNGTRVYFSSNADEYCSAAFATLEPILGRAVKFMSTHANVMAHIRTSGGSAEAYPVWAGLLIDHSTDEGDKRVQGRALARLEHVCRESLYESESDALTEVLR